MFTGRNITNVTMPFLPAEVANGTQLLIKSVVSKGHHGMVTGGHKVVV
jgi:hypothetical protein